MKAPWKFALLAVVGVLFAAATIGPPTREAEAAPMGVTVYQGTCPLSFPLPAEATELVPGNTYCVNWTSEGTAGTITLAVTNVVGGTLTHDSCRSGSTGSCGAATGSGTATISYNAPASGLGNSAETTFAFTGCSGPNVTFTSTQGTSLVEELPCAETGPAPTVGLTLYPGTCASLPLPLPAEVTSVAPETDYCVVTGASDHVTGDTHTVSSAGVAGSAFDLDLCFTNSAGFDPCTDPGPGTTPYEITLESEDANSFVGAQIDFSFTACEESTLGLTYSYDGPGLAPASVQESFECTAEGTPPVGDFVKYTDEEDEVLEPGESFVWFIDVPSQAGFWTVTDLLPRGFEVDGPLPSGCWSIGRFVYCTGFSFGGSTLAIPVAAPEDCGEYTNTARLIPLPAFGLTTGSDSVSVEGCETPAGDTGTSGSTGSGSSSSGGSFWERLWGQIF